uniref:Uncharacterized protein n=1 Tax=Opuntia streptacantha TaxID=393608 RepID=A0A7C8Z580_OPUST
MLLLTFESNILASLHTHIKTVEILIISRLRVNPLVEPTIQIDTHVALTRPDFPPVVESVEIRVKIKIGVIIDMGDVVMVFELRTSDVATDPGVEIPAILRPLGGVRVNAPDRIIEREISQARGMEAKLVAELPERLLIVLHVFEGRPQ